jgi:hypothetical protein
MSRLSQSTSEPLILTLCRHEVKKSMNKLMWFFHLSDHWWQQCTTHWVTSPNTYILSSHIWHTWTTLHFPTRRSNEVAIPFVAWGLLWTGSFSWSWFSGDIRPAMSDPSDDWGFGYYMLCCRTCPLTCHFHFRQETCRLIMSCKAIKRQRVYWDIVK